jgi:hypothetical protein
MLRRLALALALCGTVVMPATAAATNLAPDTDPRAFVLADADLPGGYRMVVEQSGPRPNEAVNSQDDLRRFQQWGRITGYTAQFEREASALAMVQSGSVLQAVSLYRTPQGAQQAFEHSRQRNGQQMDLLGTPLVGEASLAFRSRPQTQQAMNAAGVNGPPVDVVAVQFRKGNLLQSVLVAGPQGTAVFDEALALAQLAASRIPD